MLVIENEPLVLEALEDILDLVGMKVVGAEDGEEGISAYQEYQDEIELVILDMRPPGKDGPDILKALRRINSSVKVIVSSGYDEEEVARRFVDQQPILTLKKPYDAETLLAKVNSVLAH
ncbi:MAG TPA: response regulator [Anaerolineae bacterium]